MVARASHSARAERIELRVSPHAKALLTAAAKARHTTVSEFLLSHGVEAAERALSIPKVFYATDEGWASMQRLLDDDEIDAQPSAETVAWLARPIGAGRAR